MTKVSSAIIIVTIIIIVPGLIDIQILNLFLVFIWKPTEFHLETPISRVSNFPVDIYYIINKPWNSKQTFDRIRLSFVLYFYILRIYLYRMSLWRMNFIIDFISWYNILLVSIIYVMLMMYTAVDTDRCLTGWLKAK